MTSIFKGFLAIAMFVLLAGGPCSLPAHAAGTAANAASASPKFSARTLDGKVISSARLAGRPYIVNFFASWCPPCRRELPDMVALQKKYEKQGFTFVGFAFKDNPATLPDFLWELGIDFPVALADQTLTAEFGRYLPGGLKAIPASFVFDREGHLIKAVPGAMSMNDFEELILMAMQAKP